MNQRTLIVSLIAVLLLVIAASAAVLLFLPSDETPPLTSEPTTSQTATPSTSKPFNTSVLDRSAYTSLNSSLIQSGQLPVKPPTDTGKANPFL